MVGDNQGSHVKMRKFLEVQVERASSIVHDVIVQWLVEPTSPLYSQQLPHICSLASLLYSPYLIQAPYTCRHATSTEQKRQSVVSCIRTGTVYRHSEYPLSLQYIQYKYHRYLRSIRSYAVASHTVCFLSSLSVSSPKSTFVYAEETQNTTVPCPLLPFSFHRSLTLSLPSFP